MPGESDGLPIWRDARKQLVADMGGEATGHAPVRVHDIDIPGIAEDDMAALNMGETHEASLLPCGSFLQCHYFLLC